MISRRKGTSSGWNGNHQLDSQTISQFAGRSGLLFYLEDFVRIVLKKKTTGQRVFPPFCLDCFILGFWVWGECLFFRRILIGCLFCVCVCLDVLLVLFHPLPPPRENSIGGLNHSLVKDKFHFYKPACSESSCWHTKLAWQKFDSNHSLYYWDDIISDFVRKKKNL